MHAVHGPLLSEGMTSLLDKKACAGCAGGQSPGSEATTVSFKHYKESIDQLFPNSRDIFFKS